MPWYVHLWLKFSFKIYLQENLEEETGKYFSSAPFFLFFWRCVYQSTPFLRNLPCPDKFLVVRQHSGITLFKCLTVCFSLYSWSVICAVTLCYVLHQAHSEFWHIQNSICVHIQAYSALLRHIQAYWSIIKTLLTLTYSQPGHLNLAIWLSKQSLIYVIKQSQFKNIALIQKFCIKANEYIWCFEFLLQLT